MGSGISSTAATSTPGGGEPLDSTFTYYNGPQHTPNVVNEHRTAHLRFTRTVNEHTFDTIGLGLHRYYNQVEVTPITEITLAWDRPHVLSGNLYFQQSSVRGLNFEAVYSSGAVHATRDLRQDDTGICSR